MFRPKRTVLQALAVVTIAFTGWSATACVGSGPQITATNTPYHIDDKQSRESVSAASRIAYDKYLGVADQILTDSGAAPERIQSVATDAFAQDFAEDIAEYVAAGLRAEGSTAVLSFDIQSWNQDGDGYNVTAYICDDVSAVDVLDGNGESIVAANRDPTTPYQVHFEGDDLDELRVSVKDLWTGADFCEH
jgi:hypothetical protein